MINATVMKTAETAWFNTAVKFCWKSLRLTLVTWVSVVSLLRSKIMTLTYILDLYCTVNLKRGQFIDTYCGEVITHDEVNICKVITSSDKNSYLYSLNKFTEECKYTDEQILIVDRQHMSESSHFINHSCELKCHQFTVSLNHTDDHIYELTFITLKISQWGQSWRSIIQTMKRKRQLRMRRWGSEEGREEADKVFVQSEEV